MGSSGTYPPSEDELVLFPLLFLQPVKSKSVAKTILESLKMAFVFIVIYVLLQIHIMLGQSQIAINLVNRLTS